MEDHDLPPTFSFETKGINYFVDRLSEYTKEKLSCINLVILL
jgi:hypothetical protein